MVNATSDDRRRAQRLVCSVPVRLTAGHRSFHAETVDLSRTGALLRIGFAELGLKPEADLTRMVARLQRSLGEILVAEFHYEQLGPLVRKAMRLVRVRTAEAGVDHVEIGCELRLPFTDEEVGFLGLPLPQAEAGAIDEALANEHLPDEFSAIICAEQGKATAPFVARVGRLFPERIELILPSPDRLPFLPDSRDVGSLLLAFLEAFGENPNLVLLREGVPAWSGSGKVETVNREGNDGQVKLGLSLERALGLGDERRLGITTAAGTASGTE